MRFRPRGYDYVSQAVEELTEFRHGSGRSSGSSIIGGCGGLLHGGGVLGNGRSIPHIHQPASSSSSRRHRRRPRRPRKSTNGVERKGGSVEVGGSGEGGEQRDDIEMTLTAATPADGRNDSNMDDGGGRINSKKTNDCNEQCPDSAETDYSASSDNEGDYDNYEQVDAFDLIGVDDGKPLQALLVATGQYLKWPLHPFPCEGKDEAVAQFRAMLRKSSGGGGPGLAQTPQWLHSLAQEDEQRGGSDSTKRSIWAGLYPDVVPGTDFAATMDMLSARINSDGRDDDDAATSNERVGVDMDDIVRHLPESSPYIRQDPDLPMPFGTKKDEEDVIGCSELSVLPGIERLVTSGKWGPRSRMEDIDGATNTGASAKEFEDMVLKSPTLKPPFTQAPKDLLGIDDKIEDYDSGMDGEDDEDSTAACYSQAWLKKSKRKWKMQRAIRESNRIVEEQRLLPLKTLGLLSQASVAFENSPIRIDPDLPTKDASPPPHHRQDEVDALNRGIMDEIKATFAPSSFVASDRNSKYREEIEQHKDHQWSFLESISGSSSIMRPPCTLISGLGTEEAQDRPTLALCNDDSYLPPSFIREDPPLPTQDRVPTLLREETATKDKITFPVMTTAVKATLPNNAMPSLKTRRSHSQRKDPPQRSLQDIVSRARVIDTRSVGQIMQPRCSDIAGLLIPQGPFPVAVEDVTTTQPDAVQTDITSTITDADTAASVRSFLAASNSSDDRLAAGNALVLKGGGYESHSWFVDKDSNLPRDDRDNPNDPQTIKVDGQIDRFRGRAWRRSREEGAREMLLTGCKMKRERRGKCVYRGFLSDRTVPPQFYEQRYLAMVKNNQALQESMSPDDVSLLSVPSVLVPPSISPLVSNDYPCPAAEAVLRIFHRSLARASIRASMERREGEPPLPEPRAKLLQTRRHPNIRPERRSRKTGSLGIFHSKKSTNSKKRGLDGSLTMSSISFHDDFVARQRKGTKLLSDGENDVSPKPSSILSTIGSIEHLGKQTVIVRGELRHLLNKSLEVAREEENYWKEMMVVGGGLPTSRAGTASRFAFSPRGHGLNDGLTPTAGGVGIGGVGSDRTGDKENVEESFQNNPDRPEAKQQPQESSRSDLPKDAAESKEARRERKRRKKEKKREKKERKRKRKREKKEKARRKRAGEEMAQEAPMGASHSASAKKMKLEQPDTNAPEAPAVADANADAEMGPNAAAATQLGFTPKPRSASNLPRLQGSRDGTTSKVSHPAQNFLSHAGTMQDGNVITGFEGARVIDYSNGSRVLDFSPSLHNNEPTKPAPNAVPKVAVPSFEVGITPFRRPTSQALRGGESTTNQETFDRPPSNQPRPRPPLQDTSFGGQASYTRPQSNNFGGQVPLGLPDSGNGTFAEYEQPYSKGHANYTHAAAAPTNQYHQDEEGQPDVRSLCSESFFSTFSEAVVDLTTGQWSNGLSAAAEQTEGTHELAGEGWGSTHTLASQKKSSSNAKMIALYDSAIIDGMGVDIELPGKAAIVALRLSSWCSQGMALQDASPPQEAKDFIRRLVTVAATGRYRWLHVLLCLDVDLTPSLSNGIALLQNALIRQPGCPCESTFQYVSPKTVATSVAHLMLEASGGSAGRRGDDAWIENATSNGELLERVQFLLSMAPSVSAIEAFDIARSPRPLIHCIYDICQQKEQGQPTDGAYQMSKVMTVQLNRY